MLEVDNRHCRLRTAQAKWLCSENGSAAMDDLIGRAMRVGFRERP